MLESNMKENTKRKLICRTQSRKLRRQQKLETVDSMKLIFEKNSNGTIKIKSEDDKIKEILHEVSTSDENISDRKTTGRVKSFLCSLFRCVRN